MTSLSCRLTQIRRPSSEIKFRVVEMKLPRFSTAISANRYAEDGVEYFSVFLVPAISATVPASVAALSIIFIIIFNNNNYYYCQTLFLSRASVCSSLACSSSALSRSRDRDVVSRSTLVADTPSCDVTSLSCRWRSSSAD